MRWDAVITASLDRIRDAQGCGGMRWDAVVVLLYFKQIHTRFVAVDSSVSRADPMPQPPVLLRQAERIAHCVLAISVAFGAQKVHDLLGRHLRSGHSE
jgi:hypothetical protein